MFEITDDEDEFWQTLPFDRLEDEEKTQNMVPVPSAGHDINVNQYVDVTTSLHSTNEQTLLRSTLLPPSRINNEWASNDEENSKGNCHSLGTVTGGISRKTCKPAGSKRKFPGPAGVLPESFPSSENKSRNESPLIVKDTDHQQSLPLSQPSSSCDVFTSPPWQELLSDIGPDAVSVLDKFSIKAMLLKARRKALPKGKIPLVLAFVDSVDFHGCDGSVILRDPSGKVQGGLHQDLIKDPSTALRPGCVIVLRQTSVISPSQRTHYLNITPANIVLLYSPTKDTAVQKAPWASTVSSTHQPLPPMSRIIEESEKELNIAINNNNNKYHHQEMSPRPSPHTPGRFGLGSSSSSSSSSPLLFSPLGSCNNNTTNNMELFSRPFPPPPVSNNNRFKSPLSSRTSNEKIHSVSTVKNFPTKPSVPPFPSQVYSSSYDKSGHTNTTITHPHSSTATKHTINHDTNTSFNIHRPAPTSSSPHNYNFHPQNASTTSLCQQASTELTDDDFLGDDSDLLSLCNDGGDNDDSSKRKFTPTVHHGNNFDSAKNLQRQIDDQLFDLTSTGSNHPSPFVNNQQKTFSFKTTPGLGSHMKRSDESGVKGNGMIFTNKSSDITHKSLNKSNPMSFNIMSSREQSESSKGSTSLSVSSKASDNILMGRDSRDGDGRDARVQLGKCVDTAQQVDMESCYGTWDDDLSDDLLSQL